MKIESFHITDLEANLASARAQLASTHNQLDVALADVESLPEGSGRRG